MNICAAVENLVLYGIKNGLCATEDRVYSRNRLLRELKIDTYIPCDGETGADIPLEDLLKTLLDYAAAQGIIGDSVVERDLFDSKLMDCLMPRPSEVIARFRAEYAVSPERATDYYYAFSRATDYIRTYRVAKDLKWVTQTPYGGIDITVNLSKPEKDPKAIAAARKAHSGDVKYPACMLCLENEGYAGRLDHPARDNHRIIPLKLCGDDWMLQYSPYVYYNEHCILFDTKHVPMSVDRAAIDKLLDFITLFPHYFVGSNTDLPIVGGSILTHEHFQGGRYEFAMAKAPVEKEISFPGFDDVSAGTVRWPMSVIRLTGADRVRVADLAEKIMTAWRTYTDESAFIFGVTDDGVRHSTVTPIARRRGADYELDIVLRNNITTDECPDGLYHAHPQYHHLKKENIGLIEVMGLAVLPSRLNTELAELRDVMLSGGDLRGSEAIAKHADWAEMILNKYPRLDKDNIESVLHDEVGYVFTSILENCGVFKRDEAGAAAFDRFINTLT